MTSRSPHLLRSAWRDGSPPHARSVTYLIRDLSRGFWMRPPIIGRTCREPLILDSEIVGVADQDDRPGDGAEEIAEIGGAIRQAPQRVRRRVNRVALPLEAPDYSGPAGRVGPCAALQHDGGPVPGCRHCGHAASGSLPGPGVEGWRLCTAGDTAFQHISKLGPGSDLELGEGPVQVRADGGWER